MQYNIRNLLRVIALCLVLLTLMEGYWFYWSLPMHIPEQRQCMAQAEDGSMVPCEFYSDEDQPLVKMEWI